MTPRTLLLFLFFVCSGLLHGQGIITNLDLPIFDTSGRVVRRLTAATATGSLDVVVLKTGTVEFLDPDGAAPAKTGTLIFAEATYRKAAGVIESEGPMQLRFSEGNVTAVGFRHELATGHLVLRSAVVLDFPEAHVTGREGEVFLTQRKSGQDPLVSSATIRGDVAITEFKVKEIAADRLETASATYTGKDARLRPTSPVSLWEKGQRAGEVGGEMSFRVGGGANPAIAKHPVSAPEKSRSRPAEP